MSARTDDLVSQDEVEAGMASYAIECIAAIALVLVILYTQAFTQ